MEYNIIARFTGRVEYIVLDDNEAGAQAQANQLASDADFGDLEDIDYEAKSCTVFEASGFYGFYTSPVRVTGRIEFSIKAGSKDEAMELAEEQANEADCGVLEDIDWELIPLE